MLFEPLGMRIVGCTVAPTTREKMRDVGSLRRPPTVALPAPRLPWGAHSWTCRPLLQTLSQPHKCFWCKGLRRLRGGWGEFEDLFNDPFTLVTLSFYCHSCLPRWCPSRPEAQPRGLSLGKEEVRLPWYASSVRIFTSSAFFHWDKKGLYMLIQLGWGYNIQDTVYVACGQGTSVC